MNEPRPETSKELTKLRAFQTRLTDLIEAWDKDPVSYRSRPYGVLSMTQICAVQARCYVEQEIARLEELSVRI